MNRPLLARLVGLLAILLAAPTAALAQTDGATSGSGTLGVLVMAHGGGEGWNDAVLEAVAPVSRVVPTAVAFGMADPATLGAALDSLEGLGVERVAVVRMFLSGASFLDQTEYLLGLSDTPPAFFVSGHGDGHEPPPLDHDLTIETHRDGMVDAVEARDIVAERVLSLSVAPARESVLLIAHGMGEEELNDQLLEAMANLEAAIAERPFGEVRSATLREDWAEARAAAEREIQDFVRSENERGRSVIVVPVRLSGFGPYGEVLEGLDYVAGEGLLPHERVTDWIMFTACEILCAHGWGSPFMAVLREHGRHTSH